MIEMTIASTFQARTGRPMTKQWRTAVDTFTADVTGDAEVCDELYVSVDGAAGATRLAILTAGTLWVVDAAGHRTVCPLPEDTTVDDAAGTVDITAGEYHIHIRGRGAVDFADPVRVRAGAPDHLGEAALAREAATRAALEQAAADNVAQNAIVRTADVGIGRRLDEPLHDLRLDADILAGAGPFGEVCIGDHIQLSFGPDSVRILAGMGHTAATIPYEAITGLVIGGPGQTSTGGGFIGGGFGLQAAMVGILQAELLNRLTTRTSVTTIITLTAPGAELHVLHTETTPEQLRMQLAPVFAAMSGPATWATPTGT